MNSHKQSYMGREYSEIGKERERGVERTLAWIILHCTSNKSLSYSFSFLVDEALSPPEIRKWDIHDCTET